MKKIERPLGVSLTCMILEAQAVEHGCLGIVNDLGAIEDVSKLMGEVVLSLGLGVFNNDIERLAESGGRMILGLG